MMRIALVIACVLAGSGVARAMCGEPSVEWGPAGSSELPVELAPDASLDGSVQPVELRERREDSERSDCEMTRTIAALVCLALLAFATWSPLRWLR